MRKSVQAQTLAQLETLHKFGRDQDMLGEITQMPVTVYTDPKILKNEIEKGVILDDYGSLPFMICSKHKGIVCAQVGDEHSAKMTRDHNNTTIITIGAEITGKELAKSICDVFMKSNYSGGRHQVRVDMMNKM